ncbi:HemK2/MTQ2 family protein methyltransferase [Nonomuraea sp. NPDC050790]|uniref:HemK2/MTQ2 family protein methyltransferase n=1 Tax=Nonomuraea sp. NPDC050790 TaxID=3364371 RepID=UPI0037A8FA1A
MFLLRLPGVYRPQGDTRMLAQALGRLALPPGGRILDLGTGTGALAVIAARGPEAEVTAIDLSLRAVLSARFNAVLRGLRLRVIRGNLFAPVDGERFDLILANPPYVPGIEAQPAPHSASRAWNAGADGRRLLDRICRHASAHLTSGGTLLLVQSSLSGVRESLYRLRCEGLAAEVVARQLEPFGPVMRGRAKLLEAHGLISPGQRHEELVVIRADRTRNAA